MMRFVLLAAVVAIFGSPLALADAGDKMIIHHRVTDYAKWRPAYDGDAANRDAAGLTNCAVLHAAGEPNDVFVVCDVADLGKAKAFSAAKTLAETMTKAGVIGKPDIQFLQAIDSHGATDEALAAAQHALQEAQDAVRRAQQQLAAINPVGIWNGDVKFTARSGADTTPDQNVTFTINNDGTWSNPFNYTGSWTVIGSAITIVYLTDPNHAVYRARISGDTMTGTMTNDYWAGSYVLHKLQ